LQAQQRMRQSSVLLVGMRGLAAEIAKNLVLTGIGSLTINDHRNVAPNDLAGNFFLTERDLGKNRAMCAARGIQELNPNVKIIVDTDDFTEKSSDYFAQFSAIILTNSDTAEALRINEIVRTIYEREKRAIALFQCEIHGFSCYSMQDLISHTARLTKKTKDQLTGLESEESSEKTFQYCSFANIIGASANSTDVLRQFRKPSERELGRMWLVLQILFQFRNEYHLSSDRKNEIPAEQFTEYAQNYAKAHNLAANYFSSEFIANFVRCLGVEVSPIVAVFGGMIAQEVLKIISGKDEPLNNVIVYHSQVGNALVKHFGAK
jgi:ubiquitin-like 1-activating enzyme E1 A